MKITAETIADLRKQIQELIYPSNTNLYVLLNKIVDAIEVEELPS